MTVGGDIFHDGFLRDLDRWFWHCVISLVERVRTRNAMQAIAWPLNIYKATENEHCISSMRQSFHARQVMRQPVSRRDIRSERVVACR